MTRQSGRVLASGFPARPGKVGANERAPATVATRNRMSLDAPDTIAAVPAGRAAINPA